MLAVEGPKIIKELCISQNCASILEIFIARELVELQLEIAALLASSKGTPDIPITVLEAEELAKISFNMKCSGVVALLRKPNTLSVEDLPAERWRAWHLALYDVQDPSNVGGILRTARWFGINTVVVSPRTADPFNPKTLQSSMGAALELDILRIEIEVWIQKARPYVYASALGEASNIFTTDFSHPGTILLGNESQGLDPKLLKLANTKICIPGSGQMESLNVSTACGIICAEIYRQTGGC